MTSISTIGINNDFPAGEAFYQRVKKGFVHGRTPFWLTKNGDGTFVTNDRASEIRRLVDLRLAGCSNVSIARQLNDEGLCSPVGFQWTSEQVRLYLVSDKLKVLQGHFVYGLGKDEGDPRRIILENAFPAIITQDEAEAIDTYNRQQREIWASGNPRRAARTTYILSGLIRCSQCGSAFRSRTAGKPPKAAYVCKRAYTNNVPHPIGVSVSAEIMEDAVLRVIKEVAEDYRQQMTQNTLPKQTSTPSIVSFEKQIARITYGITRLSTLYESGHMQLEDFDRRYQELVDERENLRAKLNASDSQSIMRVTAQQAIDEVNAELTPEVARRLVLAFVQKIEAPVMIDVPVGLGKVKKQRAVWVSLKLPMLDGTRRILAPLYDPRYKGDRVLLDRE